MKPHSRVTASTCAAKASFSSIRSMSESFRSGLRQRLRRRRHRADAHRLRRHAGHAPATTSRASGRSPSSAAFSGVVTIADRRAVVLPAGVAGGDRGLGVVLAHDRPERGELLDVRVGRGCARRGRRRCRPSGRVHRHRHDLVGEPAGLRRRRPRAGGCGRRTRPAPRAGSRTRARRFSAVSIMPPGTGWFLPPAVTRPRASPSCSSTPGPALTPQRIAGRVERRVAHRLRAAGQHAGPTAPVCTCIAAYEHRLQARSRSGGRSGCPSAVDRQAGVERRHPADRRGVHRRVAVPEDDVVDRLRRQPGALHQRADHRGGQLVRRARPAGTRRTRPPASAAAHR